MSKNLEALVWEAEQKWVGAFGEEDGTPDFLFLFDLISEVREEEHFRKSQNLLEAVVEGVIASFTDEAASDGEFYTLPQLAQLEEWISARAAEVI